MKIECVAITHNGLVRPGNEDTILCDGWMRNLSMLEPVAFSCKGGSSVTRLFAVADGLGGHSSGEVASQFALAQLCSAVADLDVISEGSLESIIESLHNAVFAVSTAVTTFRGMGTTLAGLVADHGGKVFLFHVGDSRIYRQADRFLQLLTKDDRLEPCEYGESSSVNLPSAALLQCIGGTNDLSPVTPHVTLFELTDSSETFLLCTDGLTDMLSQDQMEDAFSVSHEETVKNLFEQVCNAGAKDNVSIMIVAISPEQLQAATPPILAVLPELSEQNV